MGLGHFRSVVVVDASGRVVGGLGENGAEGPLEGPGIERTALPGGGFLIARRSVPSDAWSRYARAFVHEARSPLNALAIYLELLSNRLAGSPPPERREASPDRILTKANEQIRRVEELLRSFGELWGTRAETTNLSEMVSAVARFSEHEAHRLGLTFAAEVAPQLAIGTPSGAMADALVLLLGAVFRAPPESHIAVRLAQRDDRVALSVDVTRSPVGAAAELLRPGAEALRAVGGVVDMREASVTALFPRVVG